MLAQLAKFKWLAKWPWVQQQGEKIQDKVYHKEYKMKLNPLFSICINKFLDKKFAITNFS